MQIQCREPWTSIFCTHERISHLSTVTFNVPQCNIYYIIYPPYDDIENICYGKSKFSSTFITDESKHCKYLQIKDHHCNNCVCNYVYLKNSVSLPNNSLSWPRVRDISANNDTDQSGWRRTSSYIVTDPQLVHQQRGEVARVRGVEHDLATLADALPP